MIHPSTKLTALPLVALTAMVVGCGELRIASPLPDALLGRAYEATIEVPGARPPLTVRLAGGELPGGLSLDPDGRIHGTAMGHGEFPSKGLRPHVLMRLAGPNSI